MAGSLVLLVLTQALYLTVLIAGLIAVVLNLILPQEEDPNGEDDDVIERGIEREIVEERGHDDKEI